MNRQHFTTSLRINLSQISLFLFGHFILFGPGTSRTQYLAPDALLLSAFPQSLYQWHTHTTLTGARRCQPHSVLPSLYRWPMHNTHWRSPPPVSPFSLRSLTVSLDHPHCLCLSEPQLCGEVASQRLCGFQRCKGLPTCYTAPSSRLLVPSSPRYGASLSRCTTIIFVLECR